MITKNSFLATCLVGAYGEGSIMPTIRLASAIGENGPEKTHQLLARSGILSPIADMLRDALVCKWFHSHVLNSCFYALFLFKNEFVFYSLAQLFT